jgi:UDP-N-acetylmuramoyl-L-alanyl-D-glutamate--2,6-diaminopimelate ligase
MRLSEILDPAPARLGAAEDVDVSGVAIDSREVRPGDLFFALPGQRTDGRQHVAEAVRRGARAVVVADSIEAPGVPVLVSATPRRHLAHAAARLAGDPSAALTVVGVTGTNGKTTTTYLLEAIWRAAGHHPGVVGTVAYRFAGTSRPAALTTP